MRKINDYFQIRFDSESIFTMNRNDGILSILYYIYYLGFLYLLGLFLLKMNPDITNFAFGFSNNELARFVFYIPVAILSLLPLVFILKTRKQPLASIGIKKDKILRSLILGILYSLLINLPTVIYAILQGYRFNSNIFELLWLFLYFLICIAFVEEVIFRGYIQTRIQTIIKRKWISIITVGIMFAFMHIPFQMLMANMLFGQFLLYDYKHLLMTGFIHIYFVFIYTRDNHILAPTLTHAFLNFIPNLFI